MMPPYTSCPFISQYMDAMGSPMPSAIMGQEYAQPFMPMSPVMPMSAAMPMPQYFPMQDPYGMYDSGGMADVGPATKSPTDPPPVLSNNPAVATFSLFKELTGFPNYGNPSRNADILYTGNRGTWTFDSPFLQTVPGNQRAQLIIRAVLDDHANVPVDRYSARITFNGTVVHNGRVPLEHGFPVGGIFTNWRSLTFDTRNLRRSNRVVIENTSTAGTNDWIAIDWMELRLLPR